VSGASLLRAQAYNNAWANQRLLAAVGTLDQAAFVAPRAGFFPSLRATLNHILVVDRFYVDALEGGSLGRGAFAEAEPCATPATLSAAQAASDARLVAFCDALTEAALGQEVLLHGRHGVIRGNRCDRVLLHLFQHQVHHRGQAHAMLSGTGITPPQLDDFFRADDAPCRASDFRALGWTEALIWERS
jgi:uncharacterized damage-inducible protein DinB